jgi:hypothetical protein
MTEPTTSKTITVTRRWLSNRGQMPRWSYNYTISGDPMLCQYGPRLRDLCLMLHERYPEATVVKTWEKPTMSEDMQARGAAFCPRCGGTGGSSRSRCFTCSGSGVVLPRG